MSTRDDDVEEFAALLRRLKARADRSYGALARRVNMNTSTLHRYCAGDAVPLDFAPVERFAALCGATPAERLELHRLWILAVAARQRPRTSGAQESPDRDPALASAPAPVAGAADTGPGGGRAESEGGTAPQEIDATEKADGPEGSDRAEGSDGPEGVGGPDRSHGPEETDESEPSDAGAEAEADTGADAGSDTDVGSEADSVSSVPTVSSSSGGSGPRPRRAWYRRRVAVTAAVVTVLLVTLGSLSALSDDRRSDDASQVVGPSEGPTSTGPTGNPRDGRSTSPSPKSSGPASSSPKPDAGGKASTPPGKDGEPSANAGRPNGSGATGLPLTWTANSHGWTFDCGHEYVVDRKPEEVPPPPITQDAARWAASQNAVHGRETIVKISVQGKSSTAVVLEALRVRVVGRSTQLRGAGYSMDEGCGGAITPRSFAVDLDKDRPIARAVAGGDVDGPIPAMRMPYRVSAEDPEVLLVNARTNSCDCRWYLELDWSSQGRTGTIRVDDHGKPFRTSGVEGLPRYWYGSVGSERQWVPRTD
ncbi:helix-turn-helix domain-containing protein [Streptomyces liliifuscus]|uniref:Helix-turn-helix domain-containing protein n=1 Tax=Streptomyces liliifuscus TaxID=2797636 RepID=A0A7T7I2X0_9ACTN|nr:helix-turn-helix transcriptional regulator [Streptomyces liliifuscus]QQM40021.1 helix-turn-helix domain-containing protein [Streptomyces liliifuscus]